jgi:hypothetical protein
MTVMCIECEDESLLRKTLENILERNRKKGKKVVRIEKISNNFYKITNSVIGIDRIDLIDVGKKFFKFVGKSRGLGNNIIYTCKNVITVPLKLRLMTDLFSMPIKETKKGIKLCVMKNTSMLETFLKLIESSKKMIYLRTVYV